MRLAADRRGEPRLVGEQQCPHERLDRRVDRRASVRRQLLRSELVALCRAARAALAVDRGAHVEAHAGDRVLRVDLVLEDHERNDVALVGEVRLRVEQRVERIEVAATQLVEPIEVLLVADQHIAEMLLLAALARHVPAAPAVLEGRTVVDEYPALVRGEVTGRSRVAGADDEARHAAARERVRVVAAQATPHLPRECRPARLFLRRHRVVERVEHGPEVRVERCDLERPVLHPGDVDIVVEIDRARRAGVDPPALQARLREHERLRRGVDAERREQRVEIAARP